MKMKKYTYIICLLAVGLLFCGCGSEDKSVNAEANTEADAQITEKATECDVADTSESEITETEETDDSESIDPETEEESTEAGVYIEFVGFSDGYSYAEFVMRNSTSETYYYSAEFEIQKWTDDEWKTCEFVEDLIWDDYLGILNAGDDRNFTVSFEILLDELSKGKYRIIRGFSLDEWLENSIYVCCEFEVE